VISRDDKEGEAPEYEPPDGYNWGRIGYTNADRGTAFVGSTYFSQYQTAGGGTTNFNLNVTTLDNVLNWAEGPPPQWYEEILSGDPSLRVRMRVDYEWDVAPESGTWVMMALGLGGLAAWTRRRRRLDAPGGGP